jgi:capsular exopolysaccharide synthesis family protein
MSYNPPKLTREEGEAEQFNPWLLIEPVFKNLWFILLIAVVSLILAIFYNMYATPIFSSTATIIIQRKTVSGLIRERESDLPSFRTTLVDFNTKLKLLNSETFSTILAEKLIELGYFQNRLKTVKLQEMGPEEKKLFYRRLGRGVRGGISVKNPKMTNFVQVSYQHPNPELCRDVVNLLGDIMVEHNRNEQFMVMENSLIYLKEKEEEARKRVEEAETALFNYRIKHGIFETDKDNDLINARRADLASRLASFLEKSRELEAEINQLDSLLERKDYTRYTAVIPDDKILTEISTLLVGAEIKYEELQIKYGERHPQVINTGKDVDILKRKFEQSLMKTRTKLNYELSVIESKRKALEYVQAEIEKNAITGTEKDIEYVVLKSDVGSASRFHDNLMSAVKEISININSTANNVIYVHERAILPTSYIKPRKKLNLILGLLFGLALGVAFSFGREYLDQNIRVPEDVKKAVQLQVLSSIPLYSTSSADGKDAKSSGLFISQHPKSMFSESVTALRTQLNIKLPQESSVAILVTSSAPREGKSLIASNLAFSMAIDGKKTLILDADLHRPFIHKAFGKEKHHGLFDLIVDDLNPRWPEVDLKSLSLGDALHLIRIKQWSGTMKLQWDSLPSSLSISYKDGKVVGSNIKEWKDRFKTATGFPAPVNPSFVLDDSEIADIDSHEETGVMAIDFINQYPRLRGSNYFANVVLDRYMQDTGFENLKVLTSGTNPKNPSEILGSEQMKILLKVLKERFDRIIIDCPPAWPLSDVSVLAPMVDGVLWVCRSGEIPKPMFMRNIQQISTVQPNIVGVVLNAVDLKRDRYYYYGGYSYYYYYRYYKSDYYRYYAHTSDAKEDTSEFYKNGPFRK